MKNNVTDALNDVFAIEGELLDKPKNIIIPEIPKEATEDFEVARQNIHGIIKKSSEALDYLLEVAKASEHPRAFEVVSQLTKTLVDANKDLLELQKKIKELKTEEKQNDLKQNVTNALFVGSTSELQKFLRGHSEKK
jgi:predicted DNA-binding protein YlxM (UPF0122 family)